LSWDILLLSIIGAVPFAGIIALIFFGGKGEMLETITENFEFDWLPNLEDLGLEEWLGGHKIPFFIAICLGVISLEYLVLNYVLNTLGIEIPYLNQALRYLQLFN